MANFLGPYWVQLNYHGALAPHSHTLPIKNWNPSGTIGTIDIWSGGTINALTMIDDLVDLLLPMYNADTAYDNYIIYKQLLPTDPIEPVSSQSFSGKVGTNPSPTWAAAVEKMFIARSSTFGLAKIVCLDAVSGGSFLPITSPGTPEQALLDEWMSDAKGWCARDNGQVQTFLKITLNLNQKLRKDYHYD